MLSARPGLEGPIADEMLGGYAEIAYDIYPLLFGGEDRQLEPFMRVEYVDTQYDVPSASTANRDHASGSTRRRRQFNPHPERGAEGRVPELHAARAARADEIGLGMGFAF